MENILANFIKYFKSEMDIIRYNNGEKEINLLNKLIHNPKKTHNQSKDTNKLNDVTDVIVSFLELKDPRINEVLSVEPTLNILMSFLSPTGNTIDL